MATAYSVLVKAKALIANRGSWYQGWYCSPAGERFCGVGAVAKVAFGSATCGDAIAARPICENTAPGRYLESAAFYLFGLTPAEVNDKLGHPQMMKTYDLAIKNAKRRHINGD